MSRSQRGVRPQTQAVTERTILEHIVDYLAASGLQVERGEIVNYYVALKSRPFVILVGSPEASKTMARLFAQALIGSSPQFQGFPVHPRWTSSTRHVGSVVKRHELFNPVRFTRFVQTAEEVESVTMPCFWSLAHMSPAELECYFSDLAIAMRTDGQDGHLSSFYGHHPPILPPHLYVTGILAQNGHCFSESVLRVATVVEWPAVSPSDTRNTEEPDPPSFLYQQAFVHLPVRDPEAVLERLRLVLKDERLATQPLEEISWLLWAHGIELSPDAVEAGQRYIANSFDRGGCGLFDPDPVRNLSIAQELAIAQEVLPRISGVLSKNRLAWWELTGYLIDEYPRATRFLLSRRPATGECPSEES